MPPPPSKRMTANPVRPARYRPGRGGRDESESDTDSDSDSQDEEDKREPQRKAAPPPPKAASFPKATLSEADSRARADRAKAERERERARQDEFRERERMEREAGFVTESESEDESEADDNAVAPARRAPMVKSDEEDDSDEESEDESSEEESSEDEKPRMVRPVFIRKDQRNAVAAPPSISTTYQTDEQAAELKARRQADADALIQAELDRKAAARAAAAQGWDADDTGMADEEAVDDTDGLDAALEHQLWIARELGRLKRSRAALEEHERERAEVERRRALATPEREAEDAAHLARQAGARAARGKMEHLQKYQHRGAFYTDDDGDEAAAALRARDLMAARYVDQTDMSLLPAYLQRRDQATVGRKGATRYRDMRSEDTGRFGDLGPPQGERRDAAAGAYGDRDGGHGGGDADRTGANASALGGKRKELSTSDALREAAKRMRTE